MKSSALKQDSLNKNIKPSWSADEMPKVTEFYKNVDPVQYNSASMIIVDRVISIKQVF